MPFIEHGDFVSRYSSQSHPTLGEHVRTARNYHIKKPQLAGHELWIKELKSTDPGVKIYDIDHIGIEGKLDFLGNPGDSWRRASSEDGDSERQPVGRGKTALCKTCAEIPELILKEWDTKQIRLELPKIANLRTSCKFCRFVLDTYNRIYRPFHDLDESSAVSGDLSPVLVIIRSSLSGVPWHEIAGIRLDFGSWVHCDPWQYTLVQFLKSSREEICEPFICMSLEKGGDQHSVLEEHCNHPCASPRRRNKAQSIQSALDFEQIRSWITLCNREHGKICQKSGNFKRSMFELNLINVHTREIVRDTEKAEYAALSYVWGSTIRPQRNETLSDPNSSLLGTLPANLPRTIEDAITFSRRVGLNFLWIDHYCIDQKDSVKSQEQIENMNLVYECAYITIVAVWGSNMDVGLPGISSKLFCADQPSVKTKQGTFSATFVDSMWTRQGKRPWDLRAWTFQEGILSSRCVFFDRSHTYMRCCQEIFMDIINVDTSRINRCRTYQSDRYFWENGYAINLDEDEWNFGTYDALVANYSGRSLTRQPDVLNACRGALNHITRNTGIGFAWGLPLIDFHKSLLWKAYNGNSITRRDNFPSWSWVGWIGRTEYSYWLDAFDVYKDKAKDDVYQKAMMGMVKFPDIDLLEIPLEDAYIHTKGVGEGTGAQGLKISSSFATFTGRIVRKQGQARESYTQTEQSQLPEHAVGDEWTLVNGMGETLTNLIGDSPYFTECDYFFQTAPEVSENLKKNGSKLRLLFIKHWPRITDSTQRKLAPWLSDIVSALVICHINEGQATRIACVHMKLEDWYMASPQGCVTELV